MAQGLYASLLFFAPHHVFGLISGFAFLSPTSLAPVFPFPAHTFLMRPHSSVTMQCRNFNLLSIDYAFRPRLRSRLTQGGRTFPWKPWSIGVQDSHLHLATHTGILTSMLSTTPSGMASTYMERSSTIIIRLSAASVVCLAPVHFRRRVTRLVSCYALFKGWLLLSQPPSCLDISTSFST